MTDNLIDFNKHKQEKEQKKFDTIVDEDFDLEEYSKDFAVFAIIDIIDALADDDIDIQSDPMAVYDIVLITEAIKALIYRASGRETELQEVGEFLFNIDDPAKLLEEILS